MTDDLDAPIRSERLDLVLLDRDWLRDFAAGRPPHDLGFDDPHVALEGYEWLATWRADQIDADPSQRPWLLRMIVLRAAGGARGTAIGHANFHAPPDERGMVEIGYTVVAPMRRRGIATEAALASWRWAAARGARVLRASIAPSNAPSIALVRAAGFEVVGEQEDEVDGVEILWERPAAGI